MNDRLNGRGNLRGAANWMLVLSSVIGLGIIVLLIVAAQRERNLNPESGSPAQQAILAPRALTSAPAVRAGFVRVQARSAPAAQFKAPPSDDASELIKALSDIGLQQSALVPQQVDQWHRNLLALIEQGTSAIPSLQEFLQRNEDIRFDSGPGTNRLGVPTLRIAFLKVLLDLPGPENLELQEQVLRATADPDEIALLARQLQSQEPGKHRQLIIESAQAALERARNGQLPGRDTKGLIEVLEYHGVASLR